ncbi:hypothetical protein BD413DRAFT_449031, partial [Trametes elegans]
VIAIYVQGGGKAGFHASQNKVCLIGLVSYVVVQVYEHSFHRRFRAIHQDLASLCTYCFLLVSSDNVLLRLPAECTLSQDKLMLDAAGFDTFTQLSSLLTRVTKAVKPLTKARQK